MSYKFAIAERKVLIPFPLKWPINCAHCSVSIKEQSFKRDICRHVRLVHALENAEVLFKCEYCGNISADRRKAQTHQATHFGQPNLEIKTYSCPHCNRVFGTQKSASSHAAQCPENISRSTTIQNRPPFSLQPSQISTIKDYSGTLTADSLSPPVAREVPHTNECLDAPGLLVPPLPVEPPGSLYSDLEPVSPSCQESLSQTLRRFRDCSVVPQAARAFDPDAWISALLPPKPKKQTVRRPKISNADDPSSIQKLYSTSAKRAVQLILGKTQINCEVPSDNLFMQMSTQLTQDGSPYQSFALWNPCPVGLDPLNDPFTSEEVKQALSHADSAPGPDGWTYSDINKVPHIYEKFAWGLNEMRHSGATPQGWKAYKSLLLFKKPEEYQAGEERLLNKFRPIALSNVSYKLTTSILAKRLSKWLESNAGIGWTQRAIFNRNGVRDNALLVNAALQQNRPVVFLDLSDAFNSVRHSAIFEALQQCGCPTDLINLIRSLYADCSTFPTNLNGDQLSPNITVSKGVKQGCPLSALLFNLVLEPVLRKLTSKQSVCLGYMDDMAVICEKNFDPTTLLCEAATLASNLGFSFNISKCGVLNNPHFFYINGAQIPDVYDTDSQTYKFLGTKANTKKLSGVLQKFDEEVKPFAEKILNCKLTPMQKLHCFRTCVFPKILHLIQNSSPLYNDLNKINKYNRSWVKKVCYLPAKATNAYIHLPRCYGGPGIPDVIWLRRCMTITNFLNLMNSPDESSNLLKVLTQWHHPHDITAQINSGMKAGLHPLVKEVSQALQYFSRLNGTVYQLSWNDEANKVQLQADNCVLSISIWKHLKTVVESSVVNQLLASRNQGRFWPTLIRSPSTKHVFNFHTKMCDWRFIHKARLNLSPLRGAIPWLDADKTCRRCQGAPETLNHILNNCGPHKRDVIKRHNDIRKHLTEQVPSHMAVAEEQRFANAQPDLVIMDYTSKRTFIVDIKVSSECDMHFSQNASLNMEKYNGLRRHFEAQGHAAHIITFQLGCLGSLSNEASLFIYKLLRNNKKARSTIRSLSSIALHSSRNIAVKHITGKHQPD